MNVTVPESAVFVLHEVHTTPICKKAAELLTGLNKPTRILTGDDICLSPGAIPLVPVTVFDFPSRFLRVLQRDAKEGTRAYRDRQKLIELMPWLSGATHIICLNPNRDSEDPNLAQAIEQLFVMKPRPRNRKKSRDFLQRRMERAREQRVEMGIDAA